MPVILLAAGILLLVLLIAGMRAFAMADPTELARSLKLLVVGVVAVAGGLMLLFAALAERLVFAPIGIAVLAAAFFIHRRMGRAAELMRVPEQASDALAIQLDRGTGTVTGIIRRAPFVGRRLDQLSRGEVIEFWQRCSAEDDEAGRMVATYLDTRQPGWRKRAPRRSSGGAADKATPMTRADAYALLGLEAGADAAAIREAYRRRLLEANAVEGAPELAVQLGRAKDLLLGQ